MWMWGATWCSPSVAERAPTAAPECSPPWGTGVLDATGNPLPPGRWGAHRSVRRRPSGAGFAVGGNVRPRRPMWMTGLLGEPGHAGSSVSAAALDPPGHTSSTSVVDAAGGPSAVISPTCPSTPSGNSTPSPPSSTSAHAKRSAGTPQPSASLSSWPQPVDQWCCNAPRNPPRFRWSSPVMTAPNAVPMIVECGQLLGTV